MSTEKRKTNHHMPGGPGPVEKAQNFKIAIARLFKELDCFKFLIIVSLILAMLSSVLAIFAPDKLSDLTDEIAKGLVVNKKNLETLSKNMSDNLNEEKVQKAVTMLLTPDVSSDTIGKIMSDQTISLEEKQNLNQILQNTDDLPFSLSELSPEILNYLFKPTTYNEKEVSTVDKIEILNWAKTASKDKPYLPSSLQKLLLEDIVIDKTTISVSDQEEFIKTIGSLNKEATAQELYQAIDTLPANVSKVVKPVMNIDKVKTITIFLVVLYLCSSIFNYIQSLCMTNVANKFARSLRSKISIKINKLPLAYFDQYQTGDILSRVTNDVDTIAQTMNQSLASLVSSITLLLGTVIMMFVTNWIMSITAILASLIGFVLMMVILASSQKYFVQRQQELGNLNGHIEEVYSGLNVVKAYNGQKITTEKFQEYNQKLKTANQKSQFLSGMMMPLMGFIGNFGYVAVCIVGAVLTMNNQITFGVIVAFISYVRLFTNPLSQIAQAMTSLQSTAAASERVFEFIDEKEMSNQQNIDHILDKDKVKGNIEFLDVVFKYPINDQPTIKNFTAHAKPGEKIAIVGPTGAGKSTMVNLLMKFYEIDSGDIKIDGISIKDLSRENIHDLFTMVLQDTWLFKGTVKENIVYNRKNVSNEKVEAICHEVGIDHFIKTLPNGYDSIINENDSISAGQRQLLTIARGMVEDAPFLILDEATSNVDTRTEELVQKAMDKLMEGRTSFIIAHRLSTIKNANLILVMKDGNIIEQGNHEELMEQGGFYAELYNSQFEL